MELKVVWNRRLALQLRKMGFEIIKTEPNPYKPQWDCYYFENTKELETAFGKALERVHRGQ